MKTLSIIIPVYNEEKTIIKILDRIEEQKLPRWKKQIIVVDDASTDGTYQQIESYTKKIIWFRHRKNKGKGAAIKTGLRAVNGDAVLIQDADLEYDPKDYSKLLEIYTKNNAHAVYGSRNLRIRRRGYLPFFWGGKFLTWLVNILYHTRLTDINTGYKLIDTRLLKSLKLTSNRFNFCEEVTIKLLKRAIKIYEVPISYNPRTFKEGKKLSALDGLVGVVTIVRLRLQQY